MSNHDQDTRKCDPWGGGPALMPEIRSRSGGLPATEGATRIFRSPRAERSLGSLVLDGWIPVDAGGRSPGLVAHGHRVFVVAGDVALIGRNADCDVVVDDAGVSRWHCAIFRVGRSVLIKDLGSLNGTSVNSERVVAPTPLANGDRVVIASIRFLWASAGAKPEVSEHGLASVGAR